MRARHELRHGTRAAHPAWVLACALGLGACDTAGAAPVPAASVPAVAVGVPLFAKVEGDATGVGLAWWAVKGAVQYEVRRATDPHGTVSVRSTLPSGTLGYRDTLPANPAAWFQLVAVGADGARSAGAWTLVNTPSVGAVDIGPPGAVIRWTTIQPAPAGLEIWRSADPQQPAARVGSVASGTTTFTDPKPPGGTSYYQVVALGGGARAASSWTAATTAAAGTGPMASARPPPGPLPSGSNPAQTATAGPAGAAAPGPPTPVGSNPAGPKASAPVLTAQLPASSPASTSAAQPVQTLSLPGTVPGAGVSNTSATPRNAPPPVGTSLLPPSPAITGLTVHSSSPVAHVVQWDCVKDEWLCGTSSTINAAGSTSNIPIFEYTLSSKAPGASRFDPVSPTSAIAAFGDCTNPPSCTQAALHIKANLTTYIAPNTTFHVVRTDKNGKLLPTSADFVYAAPPQPQEPGSFSATEPQFGQVSLTWNPAPNATAYLITEKGSTAPPARVPNQSTVYRSATLFKNVSPGAHTYQIASDYGVPVSAVGLPEASVLVHRMPPQRGVPFLTKNNGAGSEADASQHLLAFVPGCIPGGDPNGGNPACLDPTQPHGMRDFFSQGSFYNGNKPALYANVTELALGRSVRCWENIGIVPDPAPSYNSHNVLVSIDCLAANHGALVGPATPNGPALAAAATSGTSFAAVWMHFDVSARNMTFVNFIPPNGIGELPDPNTAVISPDFKWAKAATLDSEGAKFLPHVCLPCHGGTYHADSGVVTGATFLPVDPSLVAFSNQPGHDRAASEEAIRQINADIMDSQPPQAVSDYINGLYKGNVPAVGAFKYLPVQSPGAVAQSNYVPDGWATQADFFKTVVKPNCLMCHLATSSPSLVFDSADKFFANKALIYAAVCVGRSMPNAELPYNNLWSSLGPSGSVNDGPAATLFAALGHNSCP